MKILISLIKKEFLQIIRDPSSILIAFILPIMLLFIFACGINLDTNEVKIGILNENSDLQIYDLLKSLENSKYLKISRYSDKKVMENTMKDDKISAMVVIPNNFAKDFYNENNIAKIHVIIDASDPNKGLFAENYITSAINLWLGRYLKEKGISTKQLLNIESYVWFNKELNSQDLVLPSSIAMIMTIVGIVLTALVIAREWERGTMESLLTTKITKLQFLTAKFISYYCLAIISTLLCFALCVGLFRTPFKGSFIMFMISSSFFIMTSLGQGLIISALSKNQFLASMAASSVALLPAVMFSGMMFEISSMPWFIRIITVLVPAKYFVMCIKSLFVAGNVWAIIIPQTIILALISIILFIILYFCMNERLE
jgi:ABC-2 type transport system permease protein